MTSFFSSSFEGRKDRERFFFCEKNSKNKKEKHHNGVTCGRDREREKERVIFLENKILWIHRTVGKQCACLPPKGEIPSNGRFIFFWDLTKST